MKNIQSISDKTAISLSLLCTIHCLALPLAAAFLPSIAALSLDDEVFHLWMLLAVVPVSAFALTMGCKNHQHYRVLLLGGIGLSLLALTVILGHEVLGEIGEKALTVIGASIIALGHVWNYRLCQNEEKCCSEQQ